MKLHTEQRKKRNQKQTQADQQDNIESSWSLNNVPYSICNIKNLNSHAHQGQSKTSKNSRFICIHFFEDGIRTGQRSFRV